MVALQIVGDRGVVDLEIAADLQCSSGGKIVVQQSRKRCMVPELAVQIGNSGQDEQFAKASLAALREN